MGFSASVPAPRLARLGGALYLINILCGAFAIGVVPAMLIVSDPATTAHNIQTHELLYRAGLAAHVVVTVTNVGIAAIFYELFKVVNRRLALLDVFFTLVATAIEAAGVVNQFQPLILTGGGPYANALPPEQLHALAYLPGDLAQVDYNLYGVFFGLDIICTGYLVLKSGFLPRAVGILLGIDGLAYLAYGFADMLSPGFAAHLVPWIQLPALGELVFALWLLAAGVNTERWMQQPIRPS
ncbi:DUF4386 domain-containing protein [Kitasatospora sp. NPDC094028]